MPRHIAIIMDGNGRWASERGLSRSDGHRAGAAAVRRIVTECRKQGVKYLTLYAFSSENWARPPAEIATLFNLLLDFLQKETPLMLENGIALNVLGDMERLPAPQRIALRHSMAKTSRCADMCLNLALNYGSRAEIARACVKIVQSGIKPEEIDEKLVEKFLYSAGQPDPDLLIRTSGELRLSNFLLFQSAYAELYFTQVYWPDFDENELKKALNAYAQRQRRFGRTEETGEIYGS